MPKLLPLQTGVYAIRCNVDGKVYVGSVGRSFTKRWKEHLCDLRRCGHHSHHLQNAWNKYGEGNFQFIVLERCLPDALLSREQFWITYYDAANQNFGYNVLPAAGSPLGCKRSEETKSKISEAKKGIVPNWSPEGRRAISEASKGMWADTASRAERLEKIKKAKSLPAFKAKMSKAFRGRKASEETKAKMREAHKNRRKLTAEERRKRSESAKEQWRKMSNAERAEVAKNISNGVNLPENMNRLRQPKSAEHRMKIAAALRGRKRSDEDRAKMVEGQRRARERMKAIESLLPQAEEGVPPE
jgi:group I intron endonuclease